MANELPMVPTSATGGGASPVGVVVAIGTGTADWGTAVPSGCRSGRFQIFSYDASGGSEFAAAGLVVELDVRISADSCFSSGHVNANTRLPTAARPSTAVPSQ